MVSKRHESLTLATLMTSTKRELGLGISHTCQISRCGNNAHAHPTKDGEKEKENLTWNRIGAKNLNSH